MRWFAAVLAIGTVVGCGPRTTSTPEPANPRLEAFELVTAGGTVSAERGFVTVPENREAAGSRDIQVAFTRLPARSADPGPPIIYLEGGPGIPGTLSARLPVWTMLDALRDVGDVILVDQRGTGMSEPVLMCPKQPRPSHALEDDERLVGVVVEAGRTCRAAMDERGVDLDGYDTVHSAADIDAIRQALGVQQVDLVGFSYGSHLALTVLRHHGAHVRRAVVMGVAGPDHLRKRPADVEAQLERIAALAARDASVGEEVPDLVALMRRVHERARVQPFEVTVTDPETGESGTTKVGALAIQILAFADMGDSNDFVAFPALYHALDEGRVESLEALVNRRFMAASPMSAMSVAMRLASGATSARVEAIERELDATTLGRAIDFPFNEPAFREAWEIPELGPEHRSRLRSDVPTLFISGTLDGNAPPSRTAPLVEDFAAASHLIVNNAGHEDYFTDPEVVRRVTEFLATGSTQLDPVARPDPSLVPL